MNSLTSYKRDVKINITIKLQWLQWHIYHTDILSSDITPGKKVTKPVTQYDESFNKSAATTAVTPLVSIRSCGTQATADVGLRGGGGRVKFRPFRFFHTRKTGKTMSSWSCLLCSGALSCRNRTRATSTQRWKEKMQWQVNSVGTPVQYMIIFIYI